MVREKIILEEKKWLSWVGKTICKKSGKPFKSGKINGVIKELTINPYSNKKGFLMEDDNSIVDCHQCKLK